MAAGKNETGPAMAPISPKPTQEIKPVAPRHIKIGYDQICRLPGQRPARIIHTAGRAHMGYPDGFEHLHEQLARDRHVIHHQYPNILA